MQNINNYILEKLKKINSKSVNIDDEDSLKDIILNDDNVFTVLETLVKYGLYTNILDNDKYKKLSFGTKINEYDRVRFSADLKRIITTIIFDIDIIEALTYSDKSTIAELKKEKRTTLLEVFNILIDYIGSASFQITWAIQRGIEKYFK